MAEPHKAYIVHESWRLVKEHKVYAENYGDAIQRVRSGEAEWSEHVERATEPKGIVSVRRWPEEDRRHEGTGDTQ